MSSRKPLTITVGEALMQMAMHSQWHRGQNATRLRELGAQPAAVDLIAGTGKAGPRGGCERGATARPSLAMQGATSIAIG